MAEKVCCKYCGTEYTSARSLLSGLCYCHPDGLNKGCHALYEGSAMSTYTCKYCGSTASSIRSLVTRWCYRHPDGWNKGRCSPAL